MSEILMPLLVALPLEAELENKDEPKILDEDDEDLPDPPTLKMPEAQSVFACAIEVCTSRITASKAIALIFIFIN